MSGVDGLRWNEGLMMDGVVSWSGQVMSGVEWSGVGGWSGVEWR